MKATKLLGALLLISLVVTSCNDDDGPAPIDLLVGTWTITDFSTTNCTDPDDNQDFFECVELFGFRSCFSINMSFDREGNVTSELITEITNLTSGETQTETEIQESTFTLNGSTITTCDGPDDCSDITYSIEGNVLRMEGTEADGCESLIVGEKQ